MGQLHDGDGCATGQRAGLPLRDRDVFVSVAGGGSIEEPAADLAVVCALASSVVELAMPADLVARFVLRAGTSWGGPDDLRRVVPRALVLAADHAHVAAHQRLRGLPAAVVRKQPEAQVADLELSLIHI